MGRGNVKRAKESKHDCIHVAIDDHSRVAYVEVLPDEKGQTCADFLARATVNLGNDIYRRSSAIKPSANQHFHELSDAQNNLFYANYDHRNADNTQPHANKYHG